MDENNRDDESPISEDENIIDEKSLEELKEKVFDKLLEDEMKTSYLDYAMSVIVSRALPDVKDGLKPVHRRILYAMNDLGITFGKPYKKSARIVGEVLGKYHPHGDTAVYDSMVRMAQDFSLRYPLIDGQGNFGSIDGDGAAAMRYCISGDSLILTDKGIIPISSISKKKEENIDLKTISFENKENKASKFFNSGKHPIIKIETEHGYSIKGSENHPILCWELDNFGKPIIKWKLLEEIKTGTNVLIARNQNIFAKNNLKLESFKVNNPKNKKVKVPKEMNKELAFALGALVSEGSYHNKQILFSNKDLDFYNKCKTSLIKNFGDVQFYERNIKGDCTEFAIYLQEIVQFLTNIGLKNAKSDKKEIPFSILQSKKEIIAEFLKGLFEGDGSVSVKTDKRHGGKSIELNYNSKSETLINQLKVVLLNFGIYTTNAYKDKRNDCYKLQITGQDNINTFYKQIGFFSKRKQNLLKEINNINNTRMSKTDFIPLISKYIRDNYASKKITKYNFDRYNKLEQNYKLLEKTLTKSDLNIINFLRSNKYLFSKVTDTKKLPKEDVFSVKVESDCHSFVANGFINHNTEARMGKLSMEMLADIDKNTVNFAPNFDGSEKEPIVLPTKVPALLINGAVGIAVGMATNIPPHNIKEISEATIKLIDNPDVEIEELMTSVEGPDFPTGGIIQGRTGIEMAYKLGRGKVRVRAKTHLEENQSRTSLIVDEIPYQVNKSNLIIEIADKVKDKIIEGIADIRDESDREGMRIVILLKKDANTDVVLNQLFKHTRLETTQGINMLCLVDNIPRTLNLKEMLENFVAHRKDVVTRRTEFDLAKSEKQAHLLLGLKKAIEDIDKTIKIVKESASAKIAKEELMNAYLIDDIQAQAILEMKLQKLTGLERDKLVKDYEDLLLQIKGFKEILDSDELKFKIIKDETEEIMKKYGDDRRTLIVDAEEDIDIEDLIKEEKTVVTITHAGYVKRIPADTYKSQGRGGKGIIATGTKEEDFVEQMFVSSTHSYLLCFTNKGQVHWLKVYKIPEGSRQSKGKAIVNLLPLDADEQVTTIIPVKEFKEGNYLVLITKKGIVKKSLLTDYANPRNGGVRGVVLDEGDELIKALMTTGDQDVMIATARGIASKFSEKDMRPQGRVTRGSKGITLRDDDEVIGGIIAEPGKAILTVTQHGFGKRTIVDDYRLIRRGGKGVINIQTSDRNGNVMGVIAVDEEDELMVISMNGIIIRTRAQEISCIGRNTQGVRIMRIGEKDKVVSIAKVVKEDDNSEPEELEE